MKCHVIIILDTTGTTNAFYEIEKRKETVKEKQKQRRQIEREEKKMKEQKEENRRNKLSWPLRGGRHLKNTTTCKQSKTEKGKNDKGKND